jgi:ankyrin repeat protein
MRKQNINSLSVLVKAILITVLVTIASCGKKDSTENGTASDVKAPEVDIHTAVVTGNLDALKQHIAAGTNLNEKDPFGGSSPLISASVFGKTEAAKLLIEAGADINFQNNDGSTPLHTAAFFCRPEIVKMLLEKNADKTIKNKYGATPYESVTGNFADVKGAYDMMGKMLEPMGLKLDYTYIEQTRPKIAEMLK